MKSRKALSPVLAMVLVLIILVAVLIPFTYLMFSIPTAQSNAQNQAAVARANADQQMQEISVIENNYQLNTISSYYGLLYSPSYLYVILPQYPKQQAPIPLVIRSIFGLTPNGWTVVANPNIEITKNNTVFGGFPAYAIQVGNYQQIAVSTNLGNLILVPKYTIITPPVLGNVTAVISLNYENFKVLANPTFLRAYNGSLLNLKPIPYTFDYLVNKLRLTSFTLYQYEIITNGTATIDMFYDGPIYSNTSLVLQGTKTANASISGAFTTFAPPWLRNGTFIIVNDASIQGNITLEQYWGVEKTLLGQVVVPAPSIAITSGSFSITIYGGAVLSLSNFVGNITLTYSNGTVKNKEYKTPTSTSLVIFSNTTAYIAGKGSITINTAYSVPVSLPTYYFNPTIVGTIKASKISINSNSGYITTNNVKISGSKITIDGYVDLSGYHDLFSSFFGNIYGKLSPNIKLTPGSGLFTSAIISVNPSTSSNLQNIIALPLSLALFPGILTPIKLQLSLAISNPSNSTLVSDYLVILFTEEFVTSLSASYSGQTAGEAVGFVKVPYNLVIPPASTKVISLTVEIPLEIHFFSQPQAYNSESTTSHGPLYNLNPTYEEITIELHTPNGFISSGTFVIPVLPPITSYGINS